MILTCRHIDQWNRRESPENTHSYTYTQLIFDKVARNTKWEKMVSSINSVGTTGYGKKKKNEILFLSYTTYTKQFKIG